MLGAFAVAFYLAIGKGYTVFFRYVLPLLPLVCLLAGAGVYYVSDWLARRVVRPRALVVAVVAVLALGPGLVASAWFDVLLARTDSRVIAGEFDPATGMFPGAKDRLPDWLVLHASPLSLYASPSPTLVGLAARHYTLAFEVRTTDGEAGVYDQQDAFFMPVSGFSGVLRAGPTIRIYKRRAH